jgi:outer membrane protein assembly factor BamB
MNDGRTSRRGFLLAAGAVAGLAGCAGSVPRSRERAEPHAGDIPAELSTHADATFRGGLQNRGFYPEKTVPDAVEVEWTLPELNTGDHTAAKASAVAASDGSLVWPGDTGLVHRVRTDGTVEWTAETDVAPAERGIHGTPTIANGTVYVGAYDGALYAFDLSDGSREWKVQLGDAIGSSPVYHDGVVYIAVEYVPPDGSVFGVDAGTGEVLDAGHRPTDHPHSTIAIDVEAGKLVVGSNDGVLYAWEYPSLEPAWAFETRGVSDPDRYQAIKGPIATHDGAAFFGSWDRNVYRVDLETGTEDWHYETGWSVMSGPAIDTERDVVFVGSHDDHLYALDAGTGESDWAFDCGGLVIGCPTVTAETVLVGSYAARLWALDREDGVEKWSVAVDGEVSATPLVLDGRVYVAERAPEDSPEDGAGYAIGRRN